MSSVSISYVVPMTRSFKSETIIKILAWLESSVQHGRAGASLNASDIDTNPHNWDYSNLAHLYRLISDENYWNQIWARGRAVIFLHSQPLHWWPVLSAQSYNCIAGIRSAWGDSIPGLWRLDKLSGIRKMIMIVWRPQMMIRYITYQQLLSLVSTWIRRKGV